MPVTRGHLTPVGAARSALDAMASVLDGSHPVDGVDAAMLWTPKKENSSLWANVTTSYADAKWGAWHRKCFHLLGVDVILAADGTPHLLEINCNPSLGIDAVHVTEGPRARAPPPPPPDLQPVVDLAMPLMKGRGERVCRCRDHHRRHLHRPCAVDLHVKRTCVGDALAIVRRDIELQAQRRGDVASPEELADGTSYGVVVGPAV